MKKALTWYHVIKDRNRLQESKLISEQLKLKKNADIIDENAAEFPFNGACTWLLLLLLHDHITDAN